MWNYEKRLQFPVNIKEPNAKLAQVIISQYGGPDGEMGASMRYLSQRYATPYREVAGLLTDIGTEELAHLEMVAAIVHQLTRNLSHPTTRTTPLASGRRQQAVFLSMPANSKVKEMSLPTFLKTWLQSKKQEPLTTTFFA